MTATVFHTQPKALRKVYQDLSGACDKVVAVGFPAEKQNAYPDGTPVASVAAVQVFGAPSQGIPSRDFMAAARSDIMRHQHEVAEKANSRSLSAAQIEALLNALGRKAQDDIKKGIKDTNDPPLSERTLASRKAKGNMDPKPLIDTHHMIDSVSYIVRRK